MEAFHIHVAVFMAVPVTFFLMRLVEKRRAAREFEPIRGWDWIGWAFLLAMGLVGGSMHLLLPEAWMREHRLLDGTQLGLVGGVFVGYLAHSFVQYWWHRASHKFDILWRMHQLHHAMPRVDIPGAVVVHPGETLASTLINTVVSAFVLGLDPMSIALVNYIGLAGACLEHWNVNTPRWLILIAQRPETHLWHHELGVHASNYSHFPFWDWLFGTYRSGPADRAAVQVGFDIPVEGKFGAMLAMVDINAPGYGGQHTQGSRPKSAADEAAVPSQGQA